MKPAFKHLVIIPAAIVLLLPNLALAHDGDHEIEKRPVVASPSAKSNIPTAKANTPKVDPAQLCAKIDNLAGSVTSETDSRFHKLNHGFSERTTKLSAHIKTTTGRIAEARAKADAARQINFTRLESKAATPEHKQAVAAFQATVTAAVADRRAAVDAADAAFQDSVMTAIAQRQTQLKAAATAYKTAVAKAVTSAKNNCAAGASPATVRTSLQTALKTARANLQVATQNANKTKLNIEPFKATRQAAVDKANADLKAATQQALTTFKAALKTT